ncbi:MAG: chain-length determining protein [Geobacteraceae bacterium GWC2_58_44]|nr:MAG: chain-length determining protein [Geobacteraceae bacterium GWC2_58_44]HBG05914.1 chain-length determining protein [Geobacter sp.]
MATELKNIGDLLAIIRRRKWHLAIPASSVFLAALLLAFNLPKKYRSTATILIEAQEVPSDYVKANIRSYAEQRIQTINQQIMKTPRLLELIRRFNLYADLKNKVAVEDIVERMRMDIKLTSISADGADSHSGRSGQGTIAFSISYQGRNPEVVQQVASELSLLYMAENVKGRDKQSTVTYKFLQEEMLSIRDHLAASDKRIAAFKQRNLYALPEVSQVNLQAYEEVDREIRLLTDQLRSSKEKEENLQSQLANLQPELNSNEKESLRQLKLRLNELKSRFSDQYPDVKKIKMEIAELEGQLKLTGLRASGNQVDNPVYVTLQAQLAGTRSDVQSLKRQVAEMAAKRESYQRRIESAPQVEQGYKAILVERNNLQQKYDEMAKKAMEASVAHGMETEQLGERFTLLDPAGLPQKPISPNLPAILLVGIILGIGSGVGLAAVKESGDDTVRLAEELSALTGFTVLATIPQIVTSVDSARERKKKILIFFVLALVATAAVVVVHLFVMDLSVFWAKQNRVLGR